MPVAVRGPQHTAASGWLPLHPIQEGRERTCPRQWRCRTPPATHGQQGNRAADRSWAGTRARACRGRRGEWSGAYMLRYSDGILIEASAHSLVTTSWQPSREVSSRQGAWSSMSSSSSLAAVRLSNSSLCRMQWLHTRRAKHARHVSAAPPPAPGGQVLPALTVRARPRPPPHVRPPHQLGRGIARSAHQVEQASCPSQAPSTSMLCSRATSSTVCPTCSAQARAASASLSRAALARADRRRPQRAPDAGALPANLGLHGDAPARAERVALKRERHTLPPARQEAQVEERPPP